MKQKEALEILKTGANIFLTGEPGSGKTYVVNEYLGYLKKKGVKAAVTASTGIAATHLGGVTVHAWSGLGARGQLSEMELEDLLERQYLVKRVREATVLVIDEVSMLDGRILNSIERICQRLRQSVDPFGGMQVVLVGDFFQLPPVVGRGQELEMAYDSSAFKGGNFLACYLNEQYRQEDEEYQRILVAMRARQVGEEEKRCLEARCGQLPVKEKVTKLFAHNTDVDLVNEVELKKIEGETREYKMRSSGKEALVKSLKRGSLSPERLVLKKGAKVMFTKNSTRGEYVNGTMGVVIDWQKGWPVVEVRGKKKVVAKNSEWMIEEYGKMLASIEQVPLRLAWAITIHKSQGMSLDESYMDLTKVFVAGQGYVALSRVRSLDGLYLGGLSDMALEVDEKVWAKDGEFKDRSDAVRMAFAEMSLVEMKRMQRDFLRATSNRRVRVIKD